MLRTKHPLLLALGAFIALTAILTLALLLRFWPVIFNAYPTYVQLYPQACRDLRNATSSNASNEDVIPCKFEGYLFPVGDTAQYVVVYGVSENIRGKCMLVALNQLDPQHSQTRKEDGPPIAKTAIPSACEKEYNFGVQLVGAKP